MKKVLTPKEMSFCDEYTINNLGVPSIALMQRAGEKCVELMESILKKTDEILVLSGSGNNGGDGIVIATLLFEKGYNITLFCVSEKLSLSSSHFNYLYKGKREYSLDLKGKNIVVDCIFGVGLSREITGEYARIIDEINTSNSAKISIDIPSGLNGENGLTNKSVVADYTIAINNFKLGHFLGDGKDYSGKTLLCNIGIDDSVIDGALLYEQEDLKKFFPKRKQNTNKGSYGKACIIAGCNEYQGALKMAYSSYVAYLGGVGYSTLLLPNSLKKSFSLPEEECLLKFFPDSKGEIKYNKKIIEYLLTQDGIAIGMGIKGGKHTYKLMSELLKVYKGKLLIDADGINVLAKYGVNALKEKNCQVILTPHIKEFSRLIGKSVKEILLNPIEYAKAFSKEYGVCVVLKNTTTIICDGNRVAIEYRGSSGLSKAGSGDVLSGIITGVLSRGLSPFESGVLGAYIQADSSQRAKKAYGEYSMTARDVICFIKECVKSLEE